jgi:hypothetical protein
VTVAQAPCTQNDADYVRAMPYRLADGSAPV